MSVGTLTGIVTTPIILGQGLYGPGLIVATGAAAQPAEPGATAITGPANLGSAFITNGGTVLGANAGQSSGVAGGDGVQLYVIAEVVSNGSIGGGAAGGGGAGGFGVVLSAGGTLQNNGSIAGGSSSDVDVFGNPDGLLGGVGVLLGAVASVTNRFTIAGGSGTPSGSVQTGAAGIDFQAGGTLANTGTIFAGYDAHAAVVFGGPARVTNAGTIDGGGSAAGLALSDGGNVANTGVIEGGGGSHAIDGNFEINGRAGLLVGGAARIFNGGDIVGGAGADNASSNDGSGDGGSGGIGIVLTSPGTVFDNAGRLTGGEGGYAEFEPSGNGGAGAVVATGNLLVNSGDIAGGAGGVNDGLFPGLSAPGGAGGASVALLGGKLFNLGTITGGAGASSVLHVGGAGGAGVELSSGTLVAAAGTISGGAAASGYAGPSIGPAIVFGNHLAATLVVDPGSVFAGGIAASTSVADTLVLGGSASGTLSGFGDMGGIRNVSDISERAGSTWSLLGSFTSTEQFSMGANAFLALDGAVSGSAIGFAQSGGDTLCLENPAHFSGVLSAFGAGDAIQLSGLYATFFAYGNGLLTLLGSGGETLSALTFAGDFGAGIFHLQAMDGGTQINFIPG